MKTYCLQVTCGKKGKILEDEFRVFSNLNIFFFFLRCRITILVKDSRHSWRHHLGRSFSWIYIYIYMGGGGGGGSWYAIFL